MASVSVRWSRGLFFSPFPALGFIGGIMSRRAKIVCTIGPASSDSDTLEALIGAGMDVARLNFSHGEHDEHARVIAQVRHLAQKAGRPVAILQDLQGPKIRIGALVGGQIELVPGANFILTSEEIVGDDRRAYVSYAALAQDAAAGDQILLNDGLLRLEVLRSTGNEVECCVADGGTLRQRAGVNLPGVRVSAPSLTDKDRRDLQFGIEQGVDFIALSFVRRAADIEQLKNILQAAGAPIPVVAKIEKPEALDELDAIMQIADAVMVARGDLGVELSPERVPFVQKQIIRRAFQHKVPVITATQMLESMIENPRPTRAEASDVANAVFDGTDAVMLSGETAVGKYPVEAAAMMARIVVEAEKNAAGEAQHHRHPLDSRQVAFPDAIAASACRIAEQVGAAAVVAFSQSGFTAQLISKHRPSVPIFACTPDELVFRRLGLYWGVVPHSTAEAEGKDLDNLAEWIGQRLLAQGAVDRGDSLVILAGTPFGVCGTTNLLRLHRVEG
jgi:pyruvate kinase